MSRTGTRWMWLFVFFDLPVVQDKDKKAASRFRRELLKDGYTMLQWSVYVRVCNGIERVNKHMSRLKLMVPLAGSVRAIVITDLQFARMELLVGKQTQNEENGTQQLVLF